jgi:hypothetical protein
MYFPEVWGRGAGSTFTVTEQIGNDSMGLALAKRRAHRFQHLSSSHVLAKSTLPPHSVFARLLRTR